MDATEELKKRKKEIIDKYSKKSNGFAFYQILSTIIPYLTLFYLAIISLNISYWLTAIFISLLIMIIMRVFMMMHDAGHGCLFESQAMNQFFGYLMGVCCGVPQYVWSKHHAYHHATNGNWNKYRGPLAILSCEEFSQLSEKKQRLYKIQRNVLLAPFGGFLYFIFNPRYTWLKGCLQCASHTLSERSKQPSQSLFSIASQFKTKYWADWKEFRHMTYNNLTLITVIILSCWYFGFLNFMVVYVIALSLSGGLGILLFTVQHNFENSYATGDKDWDYYKAALEGTSYLDLHPVLHWFTADIGFHHVHHLSARIPNYKLRACHEEYQELFKDVPTIKLGQALKAFQYILWDESIGRLITIDQYFAQYSSKPLYEQS